MSGKRITIRRGRVEAPTVVEEPSALAKAEQAKPTGFGLPGWHELVDSFLSEEVTTNILLNGSSTRRRSPTNPVPEPIRETVGLPENGVTMPFVGLDPAEQGAERTFFVRHHDTRGRADNRGAPVLEINRNVMTMETVISLRIYLRGPNAPPSYCVARFRDDELRAASLSYETTPEIQREIVNRLILSMRDALQEMLVEALDTVNRNDEGFRREISRMSGVGGRGA